MKMTKTPYIVAVDGPAASGKSSICKRVCAKLNWKHINTGLLYRAIGYLMMEEQIAADNEPAICNLIKEFDRHFHWQYETEQLFFKQRNLTPCLESEIAGKNASLIAQVPLIREMLLIPQRQLAFDAPHGVIIDGRDIGTIVFPDAALKLFMTASLAKRAERRLKQLMSDTSQPSLGLAAITEQIRMRDIQDQERKIAPLVRAEDAILIDSSELTVEETVVKVLELIEQTFNISCD